MGTGRYLPLEVGICALSLQNNISILDLQPPPATSPLAAADNARRVLFYKCYVTSWSEQRDGFAACISRFGALDVVSVNAGIAEFRDQLFTDKLDRGTPLYSAAKHGTVGLMRALKRDTATLNIATSVVAPAITVTPILTYQGRRKGASLAERAADMAKIGVPINKPETIALAVGHLVTLGTKGSGQGILVQKDQMVDLERGLAESRESWMGRDML